ncbi:FtsX-like permease family protein [Parapedobacter koreensis]|uniref:Putative ABC transport system permease protein n=1 Tax=Parapedobacter koreensis TaxID=332977 RepID=A0A1H7QX12_9SPHI|nr:FtsX-like permease family protein [Parapedobacter koreensis]SEL52463.1 putative ABC transport system permease protein [Parapedobacter koreensis]
MPHHIKLVFRTMLKGRLYTLINILGLTLGITACLLIGTVVFDELSYDKHWSHSADTYRLLSIRRDGGDYTEKGGTVYAALAPTLKRIFPEVVDYSEIYPAPIHLKIDKADPSPLNAVMLYADTAVRHVLDINLIAQEDLIPAGDIKKVIVSEQFGKTHFADTNPLGKRFYDVPNYEEKANEYVIAGVMKDIPTNTHLRADMILLSERKEWDLNKDRAGRMYARHYILLRKGTDPQAFEQKINKWYQDFTEADKTMQFALQPMADIYLKTNFPAYQPVKGNIQHSYILSAVAILLLLIACINYINLSTARANSRIKETGVRKILGASRRHIMAQSLIESLLTFSIAGCIALLCYQLALPSLQRFIGHPLAFSFGEGWSYIACVSLVFLSVCLFSGLYPAWLVAGFSAVGNINQVLKGKGASQGGLRQGLVVLQFVLSIVILVAMLAVQQQVDFLKTKDVGFDTEGLLSINHVSWDNKSNALKAELAKNPDILSLSFSNWLPTDGAGTIVRTIEDPRDPSKKVEVWYIDGEPNMAETLGLRLQKGRFLDPSKPGDAIDAGNFEAEDNALRPCLMTASTAHLLGDDRLNQPFHEVNAIPVGIVEDFNSESLHKATVPTLIVGYRNPSYGSLLIRSRAGAERRVMRTIAGTWNDLYPEKLLDMQLVKETLAKQYEAEEKLQELFRLFSLLTMSLAALGVFGLIVHAISLRVKEIGIRKVLGATVASIVTLFAKDFVKLIGIAVIIASPIAWWAMNRWLEDFAYRIAMEWWMFAAAGLMALALTLATIGLQAIRAAMANPVESLRDE